MNISPMQIESIRVQRLDIPLAQPIKMSFGLVKMQNVILVRVMEKNGLEGIGEASILGGPYWGSESAESVIGTIENYISPLLTGQSIMGIGHLSALMGSNIKGNAAARAAVEMACIDLFGKSLGISSAAFLGGLQRATLPVAWTLSMGSADADIEEGEYSMATRGHTRFKVKLGRHDVATDVARVTKLLQHFEGRATFIADVNQGWDINTAMRYLPGLQEAGLEAIEQPLPAADTAGAALLRNTFSMEVMADEALASLQDGLRIASRGQASAFALKPNRDGGLWNSRQLAEFGYTAGLKLYGGTALETSVGTAANALLYGALPALALGTELFGPLRLSEDICQQSFTVSNGQLAIPSEPGLGVTLDEDKIRHLLSR